MQYRPAPQDFQLHPRSPRRHLGATAIGWSALFGAVLLGGLFAADPPQAAAVKTAQPQLVQHVVQQQLNALAHEDAQQAFALADPDFRTQFGTPEAFLATVREQYPMLMHPARLLFLKPASDGSIALQKVRMVDDAGITYTLTYLLNRQQDDQWRIAGCVVTPQGREILT